MQAGIIVQQGARSFHLDTAGAVIHLVIIAPKQVCRDDTENFPARLQEHDVGDQYGEYKAKAAFPPRHGTQVLSEYRGRAARVGRW